MTASRNGDRFFVQRPGIPPMEIVAASDNEFFTTAAAARFIFRRDEAGVVTGLSIVQASGTRDAVRVRPAPPSASRPVAQYAGTFHSEELDGDLSLEAEGERLVAVGPSAWRMALEPRGRERFMLAGDGEIEFIADESDAITGFTLSMTRARNLTYERTR